MKTQPASRNVELSTASRPPIFAEKILSNITSPVRGSALPERELKTRMRDSLSFSICFAIISALTGAMLFARVGVTISTVTSILFYISLSGMVAFAVRAILLARQGIAAASQAASLN